MIDVLRANIQEYISDSNACHVIQKALDDIPIHKLGFIFETINSAISTYTHDQYACKVIQKLLLILPLSQTNGIVDELMKDIQEHCLSNYANYIVQFVLSNKLERESKIVLKVILDNFLEFSQAKCGRFVSVGAITHPNSHVVEKSIEMCNPAFKQNLVNALIQNSYCS